jgi:hypothetical protein
VQPVSLDVEDAVELGELLGFLGRWLTSDHERLGASLAGFLGSVGYELEELQRDIARFAFLLSGEGGDVVLDGGER